jgi:hypothetical protein
MSQVMSGLRLISERTGSAAIIIHHERKSNNGKSRAGESLRGHSSIEAAFDLVLQVERESGNTISVSATKTRDGDVLPFGCEFRYTADAKNAQKLLAASFVPSDCVSKSPDGIVEETMRELLMLNPSLNQSKLSEKLNTKQLKARTLLPAF